MQRFTVLLDDYFARGLAARQGVPTVRYFADALNLSANYFGDLVKAQTGRAGLGQLIQQHLIAQACHRLTSTTDTVSQIAYALGFGYPQYFSRLFGEADRSHSAGVQGSGMMASHKYHKKRPRRYYRSDCNATLYTFRLEK